MREPWELKCCFISNFKDIWPQHSKGQYFLQTAFKQLCFMEINYNVLMASQYEPGSSSELIHASHFPSLIPVWLVMSSLHVLTVSRLLKESSASIVVPQNPVTPSSRANLSFELQILSLGVLCAFVPDGLHSLKWCQPEGHTFILSP